MLPKLRACVGVAPTSKGIVFRLGDKFLEIKGKDCSRWFQRIEPLLKGQTSMDQAREVLDAEEYALFGRVVDKLQRAGMIYEAAADDCQLLAESIVRRHSAVLARIEAHNARPVRAFAKARQLRVVVAGEVRRVVPILEACTEAGIFPRAVYAPARNSSDAEFLADCLSRKAFADNGQSADVLCQASFYDLLVAGAPFDVFLLAGSEENDRELLTMLAASTLHAAPSVFRLALYDESAVAAALVLSAGAGCPTCISEYYRSGDCAGPMASEPDIESGLAIASRLLVQHLLDSETGVLPRPSRPTLSEVNLSTCEVRRRPLFPHPDCNRCSAVPSLSTRKWPVGTRESTAIDAKQLWNGAETSYVDAKTGLVAEVSEGRLLQFPYHQSAARRHSSVSSVARKWITDAGDDIYEARIAVLRRAIECYLHERLLTFDSDSLPPTYTVGDSDGRGWKGDSLPRGIVASAFTGEELLKNGFLQALGRYAHETSLEWADVEICRSTGAIADDLVLGYFDDMKLLSAFSVQRNLAMARNGLEVLRFAQASNVVSVVAGMDSEAIWKVGLRDLWLDVTGSDAFGPAWDAWRAIRFRASGSTATTSSTTSSLIRDFVEGLGLQLQLRLLESPITIGAEPILFAHSFVFDCSAAVRPHPAERVMSSASQS